MTVLDSFSPPLSRDPTVAGSTKLGDHYETVGLVVGAPITGELREILHTMTYFF